MISVVVSNTSNSPIIEQEFLLVEDDAFIAKSIISMFEDMGVISTWAKNFDQAMKIANSSNRVDFALVDYNLNGILSEPIISALTRRGIYTVICTGYDPDIIDHRIRHLPICQKPFTKHKLLSAIASYQAYIRK